MASRKNGWIKSILQTLLIVLVASVILDIWRSPRQPVAESEQMWPTSTGRVVQLQKLGNERATLISRAASAAGSGTRWPRPPPRSAARAPAARG